MNTKIVNFITETVIILYNCIIFTQKIMKSNRVQMNKGLCLLYPPFSAANITFKVN
jgi:hypothetical protein